MFVKIFMYIVFSVDIYKSLHLSMLHLHDTLAPGLAVRHASHMDPDCSIDNCVTFINGPVLMALKLKYDTTHINNDPWTEFLLQTKICRTKLGHSYVQHHARHMTNTTLQYCYSVNLGLLIQSSEK